MLETVTENNPILKSALDLASLGFNIFPLRVGSKKPAISEFSEYATTDQEKIKIWWRNNPAFNIGIFTGRFNGGKEALIGIDVDNKGDKNGSNTLLELELQGFDFPDTFTQETPTGGKHLIYKNSEAVKQGVDVLGPGLDIRSRGGYLVGSGSIIDGKAYTSHGTVIENIPEKLLEKFQRAPDLPKPAEIQELPLEINEQRAEVRAVEYLKKDAPLALQGDGGDHITFTVAAKLKDFGVSQDLAFQLMLEHWNHRCQPPWQTLPLSEKVWNAYKYGTEPPGVLNPEVVFDKVEPQKEEEAKLNPVEELNKRYAFVLMGGKALILDQGDKDDRFIGLPAFHQFMKTETIAFEDRVLPISHLWMKHNNRRTYESVCFYPGEIKKPGVYNLWKGFTVKPKSDPLNQSMLDFLGHAKENICQNDEALYQWLITFFAHLIQKPWEKPRVAVVFKGRKGVGKNAFIERIGHLLGRHSVLASNSRYLTGNFNSHLENCLLLTLDEAFWSGDKRSEGVLKDLVTGRNHLIERKGFEAYVVPSYVRTVIIGNEDWLVPASSDERRFAVFEVGESRMNDFDFFRTINEGMENGGYSALLHFLNTFDLTKADIDQAPKTQALHDQKIKSLNVFEEWVYESLRNGKFTEQDNGGKINKKFLRDEYRNYSKEKNSRSRIESDETIGRFLIKCFGAEVTRLRVEGERQRFYLLPPMEECRKMWDKYIGFETEWEEL